MNRLRKIIKNIIKEEKIKLIMEVPLAHFVDDTSGSYIPLYVQTYLAKELEKQQTNFDIRIVNVGPSDFNLREIKPHLYDTFTQVERKILEDNTEKVLKLGINFESIDKTHKIIINSHNPQSNLEFGHINFLIHDIGHTLIKRIDEKILLDKIRELSRQLVWFFDGIQHRFRVDDIEDGINKVLFKKKYEGFLSDDQLASFIGELIISDDFIKKINKLETESDVLEQPISINEEKKE